MNNLEEAVSLVGLNRQEAKIYITLLQRGECFISEIARYSGIKRATVYQYIHSLATKDVIRKTVKGKRILYFPEDPKKLIGIFRQRETEIKKIFPELEKMYVSSSSKPAVSFYEGKEGLRSVYREMTKTSQTLWSMFSAERYFEVFSEKDSKEFVQNVYENGGRLCDLVQNSKIGAQYVKEKWGGEIAISKLLPADFDFSVDLLISGNKIAMISFEHLIAVVIDNSGIAQLQKSLLKFIWKGLSKVTLR
jgi:predicted DNA-binding transcriptional regulator